MFIVFVHFASLSHQLQQLPYVSKSRNNKVYLFSMLAIHYDKVKFIDVT